MIMAAAIKAGKHVFGEKPLTREPYEARVMRELALKHKVATQMGNQGSSRTTFQQAKTLVQAGLLGDVTEVHVWNGGSQPQGDGPRKGGGDLTPPTRSQPVPEHLNWDLWLAGAAQRDYNEMWYGTPGEKWRGNWKRWRDFATCGWAGPPRIRPPCRSWPARSTSLGCDRRAPSRTARSVSCPTCRTSARYGFPAGRWFATRCRTAASCRR